MLMDLRALTVKGAHFIEIAKDSISYDYLDSS